MKLKVVKGLVKGMLKSSTRRFLLRRSDDDERRFRNTNNTRADNSRAG